MKKVILKILAFLTVLCVTACNTSVPTEVEVIRNYSTSNDRESTEQNTNNYSEETTLKTEKQYDNIINESIPEWTLSNANSTASTTFTNISTIGVKLQIGGGIGEGIAGTYFLTIGSKLEQVTLNYSDIQTPQTLDDTMSELLRLYQGGVPDEPQYVVATVDSFCTPTAVYWTNDDSSTAVGSYPVGNNGNDTRTIYEIYEDLYTEFDYTPQTTTDIIERILPIILKSNKSYVYNRSHSYIGHPPKKRTH
jgi:hypothetical protein